LRVTQQLADEVKQGIYRAKLILRKYIPKMGGKLRPLGIPTIADKLLQRAVAKLLEAIYEQDFLSCSYGYRRGIVKWTPLSRQIFIEFKIESCPHYS